MKKQQTLKWSTLYPGEVEQIDYPKPKRTVKPWTQSQFVTDYLLARDRVLWKLFPGSRVEIEEMHVNDKKVEIENSQLIIKL